MSYEPTFRPISKWPREFTKGRKNSPFRARYDQTMRLLRQELFSVKASSVVVQLAVSASQFRVSDGKPYAYATYAHPGVIVSFEKGSTPLQFPCDRFTTWIANLHAIALALEALRKVDRYGVTTHGEQYRGWNALPPAIITPPSMTVEEAARFIANAVGTGPKFLKASMDVETFREWYRTAAKRYHHDTSGGQYPREWETLQTAKAVLDRHHGL